MLMVNEKDSCFSDIAHFLIYKEFPRGLNPKNRKDLKMKVGKYIIWEDNFYKHALDETLFYYRYEIHYNEYSLKEIPAFLY